MDNKILTTVITLTVAVICVAVIMMPVLNDATTTEKTFNNEGIYYMQNPTETVSLVYSGGTDWIIDGEPLDYTVLGATNILVLDDTIYVRNVGQVRGSVYAGWTSAELSIGDGTVTGTAVSGDNTTTINWTYTTVYVATNDHDAQFIMTNPSNPTYIKSDSNLYGLGLSTVKDGDGVNQFVTFSVVVDGIDNATVTSPTEAITVENVTVNCEKVDGYIDLYKFTSVTFDAKWGDSTTPITYNIIIAPSSVTAELSQHLSDSENGILKAVPVFMICAILVVAIGMLYVRDRD